MLKQTKKKLYQRQVLASYDLKLNDNKNTLRKIIHLQNTKKEYDYGGLARNNEGRKGEWLKGEKMPRASKRSRRN